jgi:hypothetical protein
VSLSYPRLQPELDQRRQLGRALFCFFKLFANCSDALHLPAKAGHEIIEVWGGWWAGNAPKSGPQQQDIIISKAR